MITKQGVAERDIRLVFGARGKHLQRSIFSFETAALPAKPHPIDADGSNPPVRLVVFEITLARPSEGVEGELVSLMLKEAVRRLGAHCNIKQWLGEGGACGWIAGYEDMSYRWIVGATESSPEAT